MIQEQKNKLSTKQRKSAYIPLRNLMTLLFKLDVPYGYYGSNYNEDYFSPSPINFIGWKTWILTHEPHDAG